MFCKNCGVKLEEGAQFCHNCGNSKSETILGSDNEIIKCGNCDYVGHGEQNRRTISKILAWLCIVFAPLITIIYYVSTSKYRCPKCKSTFLGIKNEYGTFVGNKSGSSKFFWIILWIFISIAVLGLFSTIIAAPIQNARKKARDAQTQPTESWVNYISPEDSFTALLPKYPTFEKKENIPVEGLDMTSSYHEYESIDNATSYLIFKYIYSEKLNIKDTDKLLNTYIDKLISTTHGTNLVSSYGSYKGNRSLDFSFAFDTEEVKGRVIMVDETPYLLMVDYYPANYNEEKYNKFINSFNFQ